jgi:hypothetical protein
MAASSQALAALDAADRRLVDAEVGGDGRLVQAGLAAELRDDGAHLGGRSIGHSVISWHVRGAT